MELAPCAGWLVCSLTLVSFLDNSPRLLAPSLPPALTPPATQLKQVIKNVAAFCACAGMGQLFVFFIIKEFGSLVNVTVTISRKFFR